jgi:hypothetical protein
LLFYPKKFNCVIPPIFLINYANFEKKNHKRDNVETYGDVLEFSLSGKKKEGISLSILVLRD